uniref:Uncharacterized protein n=1 Tax=Arundo donax TaxID=35708 RepID=A0A0A8ZWI9_ARUDO
MNYLENFPGPHTRMLLGFWLLDSIDIVIQVVWHALGLRLDLRTAITLSCVTQNPKLGFFMDVATLLTKMLMCARVINLNIYDDEVDAGTSLENRQLV